MELRSPRPTGTRSPSGNDLQREAAMRVQARVDAEIRRKQHAEMAQRLKSLLALVFALAVIGGGWWVWKTGKLDAYVNRVNDDSDTAVDKQKSLSGSTDAMAVSPKAKVSEEALVSKIEANVDAYNDAEAKFAGATVDYWKNAISEDRPAKGKPPLAFTGLVPDGNDGHLLFELTLASGKPLEVKRLTAGRGAVALSKGEFEKIVAKTPYLVVREGRAYFCSNAKPKDSYPVPKTGESFNPSREEYGALLPQMTALKVKSPIGRYEVTLNLTKFNKVLPIATVGFGDGIGRAAFEQAARSLVDDADVCETLLAGGKVVVKPVK